MSDTFARPVVVDENPGWGYITEWYCDPPDLHQSFVAVREEWDEGYTVRCIFEWEAA